MPRLYFFYFLLFFGFTNLQSQSIQKYVYDNQSGQAIRDVHLIVTNSSVSTVTDDIGAYVLSERDILGQDVIFSHINYELLTFTVDLGTRLPDTIFLEPSSLKLEEVVVSAGRTNDKAKRMKKLKYDMFMSDDVRINRFFKRCKIQNDEVIFFEEKDKGLIASSNGLVELHNAYLGYDLYFILEKYWKKGDNAQLNGKATFRETKASATEVAKYLARRETLYEMSMPKFLGHLLSGSIEQSSFRVFVQDPINPEKGHFELLEAESYRDFVLSTDVEDVYAFICPSVVEVVNGGRSSTIYSESGVILFNSSGVLLNSSELKIEGYWARLSVTELLPNNFKDFNFKAYPKFDFSRDYSIGEVKSQALNLKFADNSRPIIKDLVLRTDKTLYKGGESIFIKGTYLDHQSKAFSEEEELVYIELINPDKKIIGRKTKLITNGTFQTGFVLDFEIGKGQYVVRAYTDYMKNFGEEFYPYKVIGIGTLWNDLSNVVDPTDSLMIRFSPEGGNLVQDNENIVVFNVKDERGNIADFEGFIEDTGNGQQIPIKTVAKGFGSFSVVPTVNSRYQLKSNKELAFSDNLDLLIPGTKPSISVFARDSSFFSLKIVSKAELPRYTLNIWLKNNIIYSISDLQINKVYKLSKTFLPKDLLHVKLVSDQGRNISERIIDNTIEPGFDIDLAKNYAFYYPYQQGELTLKLGEKTRDLPAELKWELKVVHTEYEPQEDQYFSSLEDEAAIFKRIKGTLTHLNYCHFRNLELIPHQLSKKISNAYEVDYDEIKFAPTKVMHLKGRTLNRHTMEPVASRISISRLSESFYYDELDTDEEGNFEFTSVPYFENASQLLQARMGLKKNDKFEDGDRNVIIEIDSNYYTKDVNHLQFDYLPELRENDDLIAPLVIPSRTFSMDQLIDEVTIKGRRIKTHNAGTGYNLAEEEWLADETTGLELIARLYPSKRIRFNPSGAFTLQVYVRKGVTHARFFNLVIVINGQVEPSPGKFLSMIADEIAYISLDGAILVVVTNPGYKTRSMMEEENYGSLQYSFTDNIEEVSFDEIANLKGEIPELSDNRKVLAWVSDIELSGGKSVRIPFKTSNVTGIYRVELSAVHPKFGHIKYNWDLEVKEDDQE